MTDQHDVPYPGVPSRAAQLALWLPGLLVAAGAIAATAHGLYEVAIAAQVPPAIAWIYPVITDGLALVAYAAAARIAEAIEPRKAISSGTARCLAADELDERARRHRPAGASRASRLVSTPP